MPEPRIALKPEFHYHIYNHSVGKENLFTDDADYVYFLLKLKEYIVPICDVLCYCLMPNHFHLVLRIKDEIEIRNVISSKSSGHATSINKHETVDEYFSNHLSRVFSNFFNTYSKHFNFKAKRQGALFKRAFMRKEITEMKYLLNLICYVHQNPVSAGFAFKLPEWKYSSYNAIIGQHPTLILKEDVINLFNDLENFKYCHSHTVELNGL